jgi:hypothetical protein
MIGLKPSSSPSQSIEDEGRFAHEGRLRRKSQSSRAQPLKG